MFIPASSEFVALCKSQVAVLTQGLGAALSAVYLTEELIEGTQAKLIPVVVYPEAAGVWEEDNPVLVLPDSGGKIDRIPRLSRAAPRLLPQVRDRNQTMDSTSPDWDDNVLQRQGQVVLPLMHEGVVMGLLIAGREDRPWNEKELATIERIARTLAIACIMDRRRVWFEQQFTQASRLQAQQRDRLDDLLHQLRNPLTALRTFGKLLIKRLLPEDKNRDIASSILTESERLQELLKELDATLDASETEQAPLMLPAATLPEASPELETRDGKLRTEQEFSKSLIANPQSLAPISVAEVLEPLIATARAIAQERNLALFTEIPTDLPLVQGNAKGLREVLSNLIDNALKYTPSGGQIDIRVAVCARTPQGETWTMGIDERLPGRVEGVTQWLETSTVQPEQRLAILISDTGPGIPPQDLEHLFERHYRGVQAATAIPGTGLGLAIAKELIAQMKGEIEVFSPAQRVWAKQSWESQGVQTQHEPARGTTFVVWLSIAQE
jgi:signal transduction histidine kinase